MRSTPSVLLLAMLAVGCVGDPIGDPCTPEVVPAGGFVEIDTYLEVGSPQCQTRLCVAHGLEGDPDPGCTGDGCASAADVRDHAYCTAPCSTGDDCPEGYECVDIGQERQICLRPDP
ncbi:MAG: hypothetical protein R3B82_15900 [Sandaracinaceae bacterium]